MKAYRIFLFLFIYTFVLFTSVSIAQDLDNPLPHSLTEQEKSLIENNYDSYINERYSFFGPSRFERKPEGQFRCPGEFEPCDAICFSWAGYSTLLTKLITEASKDLTVYLGVSSYSANSAKKALERAGAKMSNIEFLNTRLDSVWMRDFGPYFIHTDRGDREIIDCLYNRPRPNDDRFPITIGKHIGTTVHPCRLIMPGGNFISDGHGVAIMTDVIFDPSQGGDSNMSMDELNKYMKDYFGITRTIMLKDLHRDGTGHIDIFAKLLDDRNIIVGQLAKPSDGVSGNYKILDEAAERLANETNGLGEKFIVHRIPMPAYSNGTTYTHTNSTTLNNKVFVPVYGRGTDEAALAVYRKVLPNHKVIGFDCNNVIRANGAIHCITKLIMSDPMKIVHTPSKVESTDGIFVKFNVLTAKKLNPIGVKVHWSTSKEGPFVSQNAIHFGGTLYTTQIDSNSDSIYYFISAQTADGQMVETLPKDAVDNATYFQK